MQLLPHVSFEYLYSLFIKESSLLHKQGYSIVLKMEAS